MAILNQSDRRGTERHRGKITGERVVSAEHGFNPAWQRHSACYALCEPYLGPGRVLDLGCGAGHSFQLLAPRETVGVDIDPETLVGQERATVTADMRSLPFADGAFASVISVHSLEHVPDPELVLDEVVRVMEPGGMAAFVTPNRLTFGRADEIIDPYHFVEFAPAEFQALCERVFDQVAILGLFGSDTYMELFARERTTLDRLLRWDPLRLRRLLPRSAKQWLYDFLLRYFRREQDPLAAKIGREDFSLRPDHVEESLDLFAICRLPKPTSGHG